MEKNIALEKESTTYNLNLKLVSELIIFHIETSDIPKKIYENGFSDSDLKSKHTSFSLYENIEGKFEFLKDLIKEPSKIIIEEGKDDSIKIQIPSPLINLPPMNFEIDIKNDINDKISELFSLYKELKKEKNKEIKDLIQKNKENEVKFEKMNNEIKELKQEIKNLKEQFKKDKKDLENDYNKKINEIKNQNRNMQNNIVEKLEESEENISINKEKINELEELVKKIEKNNSLLQNQILFLTFNNFENFKTIFEDYYKNVTEEGYSTLYGEYYKSSYNVIVELIFEHIKRKKEKDNKKIMEMSDGKKYEKYDESNWNWFLINNVIYQMIFCDIKLNEDGVEEAIKNIYKFNSYFEKYKTKLNEAKNDIKDYVKDFKIGNVIEGIKRFKILKMNLLPEVKKLLGK